MIHATRRRPRIQLVVADLGGTTVDLGIRDPGRHAPRDDIEVLPGVVETVHALQERGTRVATTTGYDLATTQLVLDAAREQGFVPDGWTCASQVPVGRPTPWMIHRVMSDFGLKSPRAVLKIGDTVVDVEAGRNAGVWTVGIVSPGGLFGPSVAARDRMLVAGASMVVGSFADVLEAIDTVETREALSSA